MFIGGPQRPPNKSKFFKRLEKPHILHPMFFFSLLVLVRLPRRGPLAVHAAPPEGIPCGVLGRLRRLHPLPRGLRRVLQPEEAVGAVHHGQHHGPARGLQENHQDQRQHLSALHRLPGQGNSLIFNILSELKLIKS